MATRVSAIERENGNRTRLGLAALGAALIAIFVFGWMLGTTSGPAIESSIQYPQAETPRERYAIQVEIDPSFYSFYGEFDSQQGRASLAGLR